MSRMNNTTVVTNMTNLHNKIVTLIIDILRSKRKYEDLEALLVTEKPSRETLREILRENKGGAFCSAVNLGNFKVVKLLLEYGADPNDYQKFYYSWTTVLYTAVTKKFYKIAYLLLEYGADPNLSSYDLKLMEGKEDRTFDNDENKRCPAFYAIRDGNRLLLQKLIDAGAILESKSLQKVMQEIAINSLMYSFDSPVKKNLANVAIMLADNGVDVPEFEILCKQAWKLKFRQKLRSICFGLESLELPALLTLAIFDETHTIAQNLPMYLKWKVITTVKHGLTKKPLLLSSLEGRSTT